ncbi:MAG: tetratricopeptide repeat protein [Proteobacteria bacterium]|nr:tetratricopeptide repeat protein [Pseudomonadota bacterium]
MSRVAHQPRRGQRKRTEPPPGSAPASTESDERITLEEAVLRAQQAHRHGQLDLAERIYRAVLELDPQDVNALHFLGVLLHQRGDSGGGVALIERALALAPDAPGVWNNLGNVLLEMGQVDKAVDSYQRCLALAPEFGDAHNNVGTIHRSRGEWALAEAAYLRAIAAQPDLADAYDNMAALNRAALAANPALADAYNNLANLMMAQRRIGEAVAYACKAITVSPGHGSARKLLGIAYYTLGELDKAAAVYREWLAEEPDNPVALHHLAACTGQAIPERAADRYVEKTFDDFAASFDAKLEHLQYRAPHLLAHALEAACGAPQGALEVLDAGCGTGLCGPLVRAHARVLSGVDLSARMLERARQRGIYDDLHKAELTHYLSQHRERWDVVLSADTLCYFGDLDAMLAASHAALRPGGRLLFTVEALAGDSDAPFHLQPNGRYAHRHGYVAEAMARAGFADIAIDGQVLRNECGEPVHGWLVGGRRPQSR